MVGDLGDLVVAADRGGDLLDGLGDRGRRLLDADLHLHRVRAGGDVLEALVDDRLGQHGRGRGAVAGDVLGLGRGFLEQLRAHVLERIVELDVARHGHAVVGDGGGAELLVQGDVAALGAEGRLHGVRELVDAVLQRPPCFLVVGDELCHGLLVVLSAARRIDRPAPWRVSGLLAWVPPRVVSTLRVRLLTHVGPGVKVEPGGRGSRRAAASQPASPGPRPALPSSAWCSFPPAGPSSSRSAASCTTGETRDTNGGDLAADLSRMGVHVVRMTLLPDDLRSVAAAFREALVRGRPGRQHRRPGPHARRPHARGARRGPRRACPCRRQTWSAGSCSSSSGAACACRTRTGSRPG